MSIRRIEYREAWERIQSLQEQDDVFEATVVAVNRGGGERMRGSLEHALDVRTAIIAPFLGSLPR